MLMIIIIIIIIIIIMIISSMNITNYYSVIIIIIIITICSYPGILRQVAWWLADDRRLVSMEHVAAEEPVRKDGESGKGKEQY